MNFTSLNRDNSIDRIKSLIGIVRVLYGKRLPDDFNVTIRVRGRMFKRMEVHDVRTEATIIQQNVDVKVEG